MTLKSRFSTLLKTAWWPFSFFLEFRSKYNTTKIPKDQVHVPNFWGVAGSEDFAFATLPSTPFDFQGKISQFCHPTLLKSDLTVTSKNGQGQNYSASINSDGLLTLWVDF